MQYYLVAIILYLKIFHKFKVQSTGHDFAQSKQYKGGSIFE